MRPVRFVALSEDGASLILTDEVGRMLTLAVDESLVSAVQRERVAAGHLPIEIDASLTPRDIQARIRAGDSAAAVARLANVPVEKVLRFAGPVLQERAAMVQVARRTRLKPSENGSTLAEVADAKLRSYEVDPTTATWDAFRREDGTWRVVASWHSGDTAYEATWDLDRSRSVVMPVDEMATFLSADRQSLLAREEPKEKMPPAATSQRASTAPGTKMYADDEDGDSPDGPAVPALSVLRREKLREDLNVHPQKRPPLAREGATRTQSKDNLPTWDDILFGP